MTGRLSYVGVVGPGEATGPQLQIAYEVGQALARRDIVVVTGGLGGVMSAASRGAAESGGITLGLLPGNSRELANPYLTLSVPTGLGEMRNALIVRTCDALISVGGSWGTLSEVAHACRSGCPVFAIDGWNLPTGGPYKAKDAEDAVEQLVAFIHTPDGT